MSYFNFNLSSFSLTPLATGLFCYLFLTFNSLCLGAADPDPAWVELKKAIKDRNCELVAQLIEKDPNLVRYQNSKGDTCLHYACIYGDKKICILLTKKGADVTIANNKGHLPFFYLAKKMKFNLLPSHPYVMD